MPDKIMNVYEQHAGVAVPTLNATRHATSGIAYTSAIHYTVFGLIVSFHDILTLTTMLARK